MVINATKELGKTLGMMNQEQNTIKENLSPDDTIGQDQVYSFERMQIEGTVTATQYDLASDSFVIDHPVYGELDSSLLKLDGGYAQVPGSPIFPATFPWTFVAGATSTTLLFETSF